MKPKVKTIKPPEGLTDVTKLGAMDLNNLRFPDKRTTLTPELLERAAARLRNATPEKTEG